MIRKGTGGTVIFTDGREEMILMWREYDEKLIWFNTYAGSYTLDRMMNPCGYFVFDPWSNSYRETDTIKEVIFEGETH